MLLCATLYYKACTKYSPVLLCITKLAQSTSQFYFVLQSFAQSTSQYYTTLHYKPCTKHFPVLLCTTKLCTKYFPVLYYFALQTLHKALPSTTLCYKACTKYSPILLCTKKFAQSTSQYDYVHLCTTKLAHSTSQYDFVLQSLHKALPSTTLYYKACTKASFYTKKFLDREAFLYIMTAEIAAPKPDLSAKEKKHDFEALFKRNFTRKITRAKLRKSADKLLSQPCCSHSNTIDDAQLQKTQPLQCVWQHHVANPHVSTHMETEHDNNHAAVTLRSATRDSRSAKKYAHTTNHSLQNTEQEPITLQTIQTATAPHTRYLSSPAAATLHRKMQGLLQLPLQHKSHATVMQPLQCVLQHHVHIHAAISMRFASPRCRTPRRNRLRHDYARNDPNRNRRTHMVLFIAACSLFITRKNTTFCAPVPPQNKPHATVMQPLECVLQHHVFNPHVSTHMATKRDNNRAAIPLRSASPSFVTSLSHHLSFMSCIVM